MFSKKRLLSLFVALVMVVVGLPTATVLADDVIALQTQLSALMLDCSVNGDEIIVKGSYNKPLTLDIGPGVTVIWCATLSSASGSATLTLKGTGTFIVAEDDPDEGLITNTGTGSAISIPQGVAGIELSINGGTVSSVSNGAAITINGSCILNVGDDDQDKGLIVNTGAGSAISIPKDVKDVILNIKGGIVRSTPSGYAINDGGPATSGPYNNNTQINISGGLVEAGNACAIQSTGRDSVVMITGGRVTNSATTNINSTIFMNGGTGQNVIINGGVVDTTSTSNTSYVIQTSGNVLVNGSGEVHAIAGRAINLVGLNSTATIEGDAIVSAKSGIAISTATTRPGDVANAQVFVTGGWVYTESGTAAIQTTGTTGKVTISGGKVTATSGYAVRATGSVEISGGFVFAYGTGVGQVVYAPNTGFPTNNGIIVAWNKAILNPVYVEETGNDLVIVPGGSAYWHKEDRESGISYSKNANTGFFPLDVTVERFATNTHGLVFNIGEGKFYLNGSPYLDGQGTTWKWDSGTLTLTDFSWATYASIALTITNGTAITIELEGVNTFVSTGTGTNAAGISTVADIAIKGSGMLNASASAGMGINSTGHDITINSGTVNASSGNETNTHGINVGKLTVKGGAINASAGGPATTGATYGINASSLVIEEGDGVVTASGNSRAINNITGPNLDLPGGYEYSKGSRADGGNANKFNVPGDTAYAYSANNNYVQIKAHTPHALMVVNGEDVTGLGPYFAGEIVKLKEVTPLEHVPGTSTVIERGPIHVTVRPPFMYPLSIDVFKSWTSDAGGVFVNADAAETDFIMPNNDVTVTAETQKAYKLYVTGGYFNNPEDTTNSYLGYYIAGEEVALRTHMQHGDGYYFRGWGFFDENRSRPSGDYIPYDPVGDEFSNPHSVFTTLTMPGTNVIVEAPWEHREFDQTKYDLTIVNGTGTIHLVAPASDVTGDALEDILPGTWVSLTAMPPSGQVFVRWEVTSFETEDTTSYRGAFENSIDPDTRFIMAEGNITITAICMYELSVENGTGSGKYAAYTEVVIIANAPQARQDFTGWATNDISGFLGDAADRAETIYLMPSSAATVTANYKYTDFILTVNDGTGSGVYRAGDVVIITATPLPGQVFDGWRTDDGGTFGSQSNAETTFVMPEGDVTIEALFANIYQLTVVNGTGTGLYKADELVSITTSPPTGYVLENWTSSDGSIANTNSLSTTFTMPAGSAIVTANWVQSQPPPTTTPTTTTPTATTKPSVVPTNPVTTTTTTPPTSSSTTTTTATTTTTPTPTTTISPTTTSTTTTTTTTTTTPVISETTTSPTTATTTSNVSPTTTIASTETTTNPTSSKSGNVNEKDGAWALCSLILCALGGLLAIIAVIFYLMRSGRKEQGVYGEIGKPRLFWLIVTIVLAIAGAAFFFLMADMSLPMVMVDIWTVVSAAIFLAETIVVLLVFQSEKRGYEGRPSHN